LAQQAAGDGLGKAVPLFERQYLTGSFYLYHSFSVIVAQPLSFPFCFNIYLHLSSESHYLLTKGRR
jgi:hypothetical protein